mmetsp:Transcript_35333/g.101602  ORF Transcript_35333/g.101602 Transcript_35333/m.101602 type:complete len:200 (+) Transcript_35333:140-739(+)
MARLKKQSCSCIKSRMSPMYCSYVSSMASPMLNSPSGSVSSRPHFASPSTSCCSVRVARPGFPPLPGAAPLAPLPPWPACAALAALPPASGSRPSVPGLPTPPDCDRGCGCCDKPHWSSLSKEANRCCKCEFSSRIRSFSCTSCMLAVLAWHASYNLALVIHASLSLFFSPDFSSGVEPESVTPRPSSGPPRSYCQILL